MTRTSKRAIRPGFDDLEGRALLSGLMDGGTNAAVIVQPPVIQPPVTPPKQTTLTLSGTITGNYISPTPHLPPGVGTFVPVFKIYQLIGNGPITITPPGGNPVTLSAEGSISLPTTKTFPGGGFLTLSQKQTPIAPIAPGNALFLELSNPTTSLGKSEFNFTIVGGVGSYLEANGTGKGVLTLTPVGPSGGTFSLTLSLPTTGTA